MPHKRIVYIFTLLLSSLFAFGQGDDNSVYSRFGLGDPVDNHFIHLRTIGGLGASYNDPYHVNFINPASLSHLRAVAFDMGVYGKIANLSDGITSQNVESGSLEYISLAMPLSNPVNEILEREYRDYGFGMAFTLMPHTTVGYDLSAFEETEEFGTIEKNYQGTGGTYKFMWGNSGRYKDFSFGLNLGYLFGKISNERRIVFDQEEFGFNNLFQNEYSVSGFIWNMGVQYSKILNEAEVLKNRLIPAKRIVFGGYFGSNTGFNTNADVSNIGVQAFSSSLILQDTLFAATDIEGKGTLPGELGLGITYQSGEKLTFGVNYSLTNWSAYKNDANPGDLKDAYRISMGGHIRPNSLSQSNYWDRVYYRFGLEYSTDPRVVEQQDINAYGVHFGLGLPFIYQRRISHANIGFNFGIKGKNSPIEEKFVRISLGFTFNDAEWFLKRRYD